MSSPTASLTALPDNSTANLPETHYGCEVVTRPDTIVYLALSIIEIFKDQPHYLGRFFKELPQINDWTEPLEILSHIPTMVAILDTLMTEYLDFQRPLVIQPVWKSEGKLLRLHQDAFDIFVWSNFAFTRLFFHAVNETKKVISRPARSVVWLTKMLVDFVNNGQFDYQRIFRTMAYNVKNDKAFSLNGTGTYPLMVCPELLQPRIKRDEIKNIILGNGQSLLSPERRLDAAILSTDGLFG